MYPQDWCPTTKYVFLVNPQSSSGSGWKVWKQIEPELKRRNIAYRVIVTTPECGATETVRRLTKDGKPHTIVVLGGDGTINEVVNGICYPEKTTLGYIPTGSGNDFTRALHLPTKPLTALDVVLNPKRIARLDIGVSQFEGETGTISRRFAVSSGIGFDASVCHHVEQSPLKSVLNKIGLGNLVYTGIALKRLFFDPLVDGEVIIDDGKPLSYSRLYFAAAMNHPYEGGGFMFCPAAKTDDRILDVLVVSRLPRLKVLFLLPTAFFGKHTRFNGVEIFPCRTVSIRLNQPLPIHTDGEPVAVGSWMRVAILDEQIGIMVGE